MTIALLVKNKLDIVTREFLKLENHFPFKAQWDRVTDIIISWIMNTISKDINNVMDFLSSAFELFDELRDQFSSLNGHIVY